MIMGSKVKLNKEREPEINGQNVTSSNIVQFDRVRITDLDKLNLAKICKGDLVLGSIQFPLLPQLPQKKLHSFQSGQN